ncbi:hypothetical protein glysoja_000596 [Glycine soja]|nr:hypothetical protein glysoja_000596 [Glycine soja]
MHSSPLLLEEPIRMASILEPSKPTFFPAMTKIVGTLGPKSRSVDIISHCLDAGMSGILPLQPLITCDPCLKKVLTFAQY